MNFETPSVKVYNKSCHDMSELADNSIQCVVTSPPYWGLRKYAGEQELIWGNHNGCEHEWGNHSIKIASGGTASNKVHTHGSENFQSFTASQGQFCQICGAWRGGYGLEPTVELYVAHSIEILREIRRVLRPDGVCFWNIADSYAASGMGGNPIESQYRKQATNQGSLIRGHKPPTGLKPKDLCLIPFRVAIAAQLDGWWVRSVIIWNKQNPMPESVKDRPTESHEYILMLTKSANYYWDQEAVREPVAPSTIGRGPVDFGGQKGREYNPDVNDPNFRKGSEQWGRTFDYRDSCTSGRNIRSVWSFSTQPYREAHFATFPEKLPETCIKAATSEAGCCSKCGMPWERIVDYKANYGRREPSHAPNNCPTKVDSSEWHEPTIKTIGWQPACKCDAPATPCTVLDPFCGSGTTLHVATMLGRKGIGYEISSEYIDLIMERNRQPSLLMSIGDRA